MTEHFDIVIIGSGAGGGTVARALAGSGARILVLERGEPVPTEPENQDPSAVWRKLRYRTRERWLDGENREFPPYMHYNVGGNTRFWGCALFRLRREDFGEIEHEGGVSPAWPIGYETLEPYYDRAEALYHVHGEVGGDPTEPPRRPYPHPAIPHAPNMARLVERLRQMGMHPSALPLGVIRPEEGGSCVLCRTCNSFPCLFLSKSDADVCGIAPALRHPNVTLRTGAFARRLLTDPSGRRVDRVEVERDGRIEYVTTSLVVASCGAVNSAALLLRSASGRHPKGLANSSDLVGRNYMAHIATMMQAVSWDLNDDDFQKTVAINDFYLAGPERPFPLGQIQSQGRTSAVMLKSVGDSWWFGSARVIPLRLYKIWARHATDWLAMTEDLPTAENRVVLTPDDRIRLQYRPNNMQAHERLITTTLDLLERLGYRSLRMLLYRTGVYNTTHQCGTIVFGTDPSRSVLDPFCRAHDVDNLFVVDASFFPSSAAVNPGLTIIAQALRAADHIAETELGKKIGKTSNKSAL